MTFIDTFGHVPYGLVMSAPGKWRTACLQSTGCEFKACTAAAKRFVLDHCHVHGYVRGVLCNGHNVQAGHVEAVMALDGVTVELGCTQYARWFARCPDCPGGMKQIRARGPFAAKTNVPWVQQALLTRQLATAPVLMTRPHGQLAHVGGRNGRTVCGLNAGGMKPGSGRPLCKVCTSRVNRAQQELASAEAALMDAAARGLHPSDFRVVA